MANLGDLTVELELDSDNFSRNMSRMQRSIGNAGDTLGRTTNRSFGGLNSILGSVGGNLGGIGSMLAGGLATGGALIAVQALAGAFSALGSAIKNTITEGIKYNATMESNTIAFEVMLGSMEDAEKMMKDISKFAEVTPFATEDLVQGAKVMKSFGIETEKLMPNLKMLGDVALGDAEKMKSLTLAFAQVSAGGKLTGGDLLQFINAGFNPLQIIAEKTGRSMSELKDIMSKGGISAELVSKAFESATSEGGRFFKGMDKLGKSFDGRMSTLSDTMTVLKGKLTKPFFDFLSSRVLPKIQSLLDDASGGIDKLFDSMNEWAVILKDLFNNLYPVLNMFYQRIKTMVLNVYEIFKGMAIFQSSIVKIVYDSFNLLFALLSGDMQKVSEVGIRIFNNFKKAFGAIWNMLGNIVLNIISGMDNVLKGFGTNIGAVFNKVYGVVIDIINKILDKYDQAVTLLNLMPGVNIPLSNMRFYKDYDFASNMMDSIKSVFGLNDALEENSDIIGDNVKMQKVAVDWSTEFNDLLVDGSTEAKELANQMEKLSDKILSTARSFANFVDIFDKVKRVRISATSVFRRLEGQVREMKKWKDALSNIGERVGENSALFQELASKGPAAAGQILAVSRLSDQQLQDYQALFGEKQRIGMEVAGIQQAGAMGLTSSQVTINIKDNNINDNMDLDIIANRLAKELTLAGVN